VSLRSSWRAVALAGSLGTSLIRLMILRTRGPISLAQRAQWMHEAGKSALASMSIRYRVEGPLPTRGLVVSNHLSYLDIVLFAAAHPCFFVSKAEVGRWPGFGFLARAGGTLFIDRNSRTSAARVAREMVERMRNPIPVLVFPEGTSTDGTTVSRFHSTLFEPAVLAGVEITAAAVRYQTAEGFYERDLCWFGEDAFVPHLWKVLAAEPFEAVIRFGEPHAATDRRNAASAAHAEVVELRQQR